jgi:UDPglucose 6-dehydrogenase
MLLEEEVELMVYDPMAMDAARLTLGDGPNYAASAEDCVRWADIVVITTAWKEFSHVPESAFSGRRTRQVLIDAWRIAPAQWRDKTLYIPVGVNISS